MQIDNFFEILHCLFCCCQISVKIFSRQVKLLMYGMAAPIIPNQCCSSGRRKHKCQPSSSFSPHVCQVFLKLCQAFLSYARIYTHTCIVTFICIYDCIKLLYRYSGSHIMYNELVNRLDSQCEFGVRMKRMQPVELYNL